MTCSKLFSSLLAAVLLVTFAGCGSDKDKNVIEGTGTIEAVNVTLSAKTTGQIKKINFNEGDQVKAGDTVFVIDTDALQIQLKQLEAGTDISKAQYSLLKTGARKEDILQAESVLKQAQVNYDLAKTDYDRMKPLYDNRTITKKQFDDSQGRLDIAASQLTAAKENYKKVQNFTRPEELKQAEGKVNQSISQADLIKKSINDSYIISPVNGVLSEKYFEVGESVTPMASLIKVSDLSTVELMIYIPETELPKIKYGDKADVTIDAFKDKTFKGKVIYISPEAEFTPKNIQTKDERTKLVFGVKLQIPNAEFYLKPGMPADAKIYTSR